jgi:DNA-binding CsgD family transcriptional regulator
MLLRQQGQYTEAIAAFKESLRVFNEVMDKAGIAECLEELAIISQRFGQTLQAARLFGAAEALREAIHSPSGMFDRAQYEQSVAELRAQLDADALAAAWSAGRALTLEQAIAEAEQVTVKEPPAAAPPPQPFDPRSTLAQGRPARRVGLTAREAEILRLVADGLSDAQVAKQLVLSPRTVSTHLSAIYGKLGVKSRDAAARLAREQRLI